MERAAEIRSYPVPVQQALAEWEAEREAAGARRPSVSRPARARRSQRSIRTQGAAARLRRRGLGFLVDGGQR